MNFAPDNCRICMIELTTVPLGPGIVPIWFPSSKKKNQFRYRKTNFLKGNNSLESNNQLFDKNQNN